MLINFLKVFIWAREQLHTGFRDIGAHQDFQITDFYMPELLLKELRLKTKMYVNV